MKEGLDDSAVGFLYVSVDVDSIEWVANAGAQANILLKCKGLTEAIR